MHLHLVYLVTGKSKHDVIQLKDVSAIAIDNKISYYIFGSSGDLHIYKHFRHFYVPKYRTSYYRLYFHVLFLQFQGNKFALNVIKLAVLKNITEASYVKLRQAVVEVLPKLQK